MQNLFFQSLPLLISFVCLACECRPGSLLAPKFFLDSLLILFYGATRPVAMLRISQIHPLRPQQRKPVPLLKDLKTHATCDSCGMNMFGYTEEILRNSRVCYGCSEKLREFPDIYRTLQTFEIISINFVWRGAPSPIRRMISLASARFVLAFSPRDFRSRISASAS